MKLAKSEIMQHIYVDEPGRSRGWFYNKKIRGWWKDSLFELYEAINVVQKENITGNLCEIGIWYGRSLLPLYNLADTEITVGVDIFNRNQKQEVLNTVNQCFGSLDNLVIIEGNSGHSSIKDSIKKLDPFRIIYIDGGHSFEAASSDLCLAEETLTNGGLIIMDDYRNPNVGRTVTKAIQTFTKHTDYNVIFTSCHQAFICQSSVSQTYINAVKSLKWNETQDSTFDVMNYEHPGGTNSWRNPLFLSGRTLTLTTE